MYASSTNIEAQSLVLEGRLSTTIAPFELDVSTPARVVQSNACCLHVSHVSSEYLVLLVLTVVVRSGIQLLSLAAGTCLSTGLHNVLVRCEYSANESNLPQPDVCERVTFLIDTSTKLMSQSVWFG